MTEAQHRSHGGTLPRLVVALLMGAGGVLLAGVVTAAVAARQSQPAIQPGSPQAAVATYVRDLQNGKLDAAYRMTRFMDTYYGPVGGPQGFRAQYGGWGHQPHRVTLISSRADGSTAHVRVEIITYSDAVFGGGQTSRTVTFTVDRLGGRWYITGAEYPSL